MAKTKKVATTERASVSRERKLALALRAVLDATDGQVQHEPIGEAVAKAAIEATTVLGELGYANLEGIPSRLARLNEQLTAAVAAGDGAEISRLGEELTRAKSGKAPKAAAGVKAKAAAGE